MTTCRCQRRIDIAALIQASEARVREFFRAYEPAYDPARPVSERTRRIREQQRAPRTPDAPLVVMTCPSLDEPDAAAPHAGWGALMATTHTPGPWEATTNGYVDEPSEGVSVAKALPLHGVAGSEEANAYLIAAAPALLAAARQVAARRAAVQAHACAGLLCATCRPNDDVLALNAAIQAAEGT